MTFRVRVRVRVRVRITVFRVTVARVTVSVRVSCRGTTWTIGAGGGTSAPRGASGVRALTFEGRCQGYTLNMSRCTR